MSAFASTSIFRLKKTWECLSKNVFFKCLRKRLKLYLSEHFFKNQQTIETLQTLVSSDGRFKNLRDAMVIFINC